MQQTVKFIGNSLYIDNTLFVYAKVGSWNKWESLDRKWKIWGLHTTDRPDLDIPIAIDDLKTSLNRSQTTNNTI